MKVLDLVPVSLNKQGVSSKKSNAAEVESLSWTRRSRGWACKLKGLTDRQRRLVTSAISTKSKTRTSRSGSADQKESMELEADVLRLDMQKQTIESLDELGERVKEFCTRATERLDGFSFDEKRLVLEALQIKVVVGSGGVELGVIRACTLPLHKHRHDDVDVPAPDSPSRRPLLWWPRRMDTPPTIASAWPCVMD
jgi:hypothetical protein